MPKYRVTMQGCSRYSVGDVVDLTEEKARGFVGKVALIEEQQEAVPTEQAETLDGCDKEVAMPDNKPRRGRPRKS